MLTPEYKQAIKKFAKNRDHVVIVGYTDGCGTSAYNLGLSRRRAAAVKREIQQLAKNVSVTTQAAGEIGNGHDPRSRRVDLTTKDNIVSYEPPPKLVADFYLIDASASMQGAKWERYRRSIEYHRPPGSQVWISTTACITPGTSMAWVSPAGGTEIWFSYWTIIDKMKPGQTLAIVSDFVSTVSLSGREWQRIKDKANRKNIKVIAVRP